jgi:hypothetical protein
MTPPRVLVAPAAPVLWRVARRAWRVSLALMALRFGVEVVGQLVVAAVLAPVVLVRGLGRWAAMERRLDHRCRATPVTGPRAYGQVDPAGEHVAFARALAAVSARYLAACEDQTDTHNARYGEGWR